MRSSGENFDHQKWCDGRDAGADIVVAPDREVGDAVAGGGDLNSDFRDDAEAEFWPELVENVEEVALGVAVREVVPVALCDFAVEIIAVGAVEAGAEIFADVH